MVQNQLSSTKNQKGKKEKTNNLFSKKKKMSSMQQSLKAGQSHGETQVPQSIYLPQI